MKYQLTIDTIKNLNDVINTVDQSVIKISHFEIDTLNDTIEMYFDPVRIAKVGEKE